MGEANMRFQQFKNVVNSQLWIETSKNFDMRWKYPENQVINMLALSNWEGDAHDFKEFSSSLSVCLSLSLSDF